MDQRQLKAAYERQNNTETAAKIRNELSSKFNLIIGEAKSDDIVELINEKTGEKFYARGKRKER